MSLNNEREVTNKCFKGKIAEIISVLSGSPYTPSPAANDNETLNCSTFEYFDDDDPAVSFFAYMGGLGVIECDKNGWQLS